MGNVKYYLIDPFTECYQPPSKPLVDRIIANFSQYNDSVLEILRDAVIDNHKKRSFPVPVEIREHLPDNMIDYEAGKKKMQEFAEKDQSYQKKAREGANNFMRVSALAIQATNEGWREKLYSVVRNLEWIRAQVAADKKIIAYSSRDFPVKHEKDKIEEYFKTIVEAFTENPTRPIEFGQDKIEYMKRWVKPDE